MRSLVRKKFRWGVEKEIIRFQSMIVMPFSYSFYDILKFSSNTLPMDVRIKEGVNISYHTDGSFEVTVDAVNGCLSYCFDRWMLTCC